MKKIVLLLLLVIHACSKSGDDSLIPPIPPEPIPSGDQTLSENLLGTYVCFMDVKKGEKNYGDNLPLYCFVTPVKSAAPDSVKIEIRRWQGNFMPHLLGFEASVKVAKLPDGKIQMTPRLGIPYFIDGMPGLDKSGNIRNGVFTMVGDKPNFSCTFFVMNYQMTVRSTQRKTKLVLPNAVSTL